MLTMYFMSRIALRSANLDTRGIGEGFIFNLRAMTSELDKLKDRVASLGIDPDMNPHTYMKMRCAWTAIVSNRAGLSRRLQRREDALAELVRSEAEFAATCDVFRACAVRDRSRNGAFDARRARLVAEAVAAEQRR